DFAQGESHEWPHLSGRPDRRDHGHPVAPGTALKRETNGPGAMSMDTPARPLAAQFSDIRWGAVIAGAIAAAALAIVLHGFALGIGFSVTSTAPTWRDASVALVLASGLYLVLVALAAYSFGGYVVARAHGPVAAGGGGAGSVHGVKPPRPATGRSRLSRPLGVSHNGLAPAGCGAPGQ